MARYIARLSATSGIARLPPTVLPPFAFQEPPASPAALHGIREPPLDSSVSGHAIDCLLFFIFYIIGMKSCQKEVGECSIPDLLPGSHGNRRPDVGRPPKQRQAVSREPGRLQAKRPTFRKKGRDDRFTLTNDSVQGGREKDPYPPHRVDSDAGVAPLHRQDYVGLRLKDGGSLVRLVTVETEGPPRRPSPSASSAGPRRSGSATASLTDGRRPAEAAAASRPGLVPQAIRHRRPGDRFKSGLLVLNLGRGGRI